MAASKSCRIALLISALALCVSADAASAQTYTLVQGLDKFDGSTSAWHLLEKNGFVVTDPAFKQLFEPYLDDSIPFFITTDSAWHGYHVLLEEGRRQLDLAESPRLADFSRRLLAAANDQGPDFSDVARFVEIALALQDKAFRASLPKEQKRRAEKLPADGDGGYFAARQWYETEFHLTDAGETHSALCLSWLINKDPELLLAWNQLTAPYDALLGSAERGSPISYFAQAATALGPNFTLPALLKNTAAARSHLTNDFSVLPPRDAGPPISSGLEFFVAEPSLRSQAAENALRTAQGGAVVEAALKAKPAPPRDSLRGQALALLGELQKPLPVRVGPALRSEAWADAQLWAQLGDWAEAAHTSGPRGLTMADQGENDKPGTGVVAPYPEFFAGLGKLSVDAAIVLEKAGIDEPFDAKTTARKLLECIVWQEGLGEKSGEETERMAGPLAQFARFAVHYMTPPTDGTENEQGVSLKVANDLEVLARRCSTQTAPADADRKVLLSFFQERQTIPKMFRDFAAVCDKLAALARQHLEGTHLSDDDAKWIGNYGMTLARFQLGAGASGERNSVPIVNCFQSGASRFYAAIGRPQTLYIILPAGGKLRLYRGAVLSYREFTRSSSDPLTDAAWRAIASTGDVPPPPPFTESFEVERDATELIKSFTEINTDTQGYKEITDALEELQARVTDRDLPALIAALGKGLDEPVSTGISSAIAKLRWEPRQRELFALLEKNDARLAPLVAPILLQRPEGVDAAFMCANFDHAPAGARRVYCALLGRARQTDETRATLSRALADSSAPVRWEAATVLGGDYGRKELIAPLLKSANDENEYVAGVAVNALARLNATNTAQVLLAILEARLQKPEPSPDDLRKQSEAMRDFPLNNNPGPTPGPQVPFQIMRMRRFARGFGMALEASPLTDALIEALGEFRYHPAEARIFGLLDGPHAAAAARALKQLAPESLARRLVGEACDKKADPLSRDRALMLLGISPAGGSATELVPLLDDTTVVPGRRPMPGREWRICDRAAETISTLLGRTVRIPPMQTTDQRDQQIEQIRQSLKAAY